MGGRNGGAMGKSNLGQKRHETKDKVVTMPRKDGGEDAEAAANGDEKAATEKDEKAKRKGAKKALRHAVKEAVKENREEIADSLVTQAAKGDVRCTAMVLSLMEKKKKDGEDDDDWDGPGLADILVPGQLWREKAAAKQMENGEEKETEAA
jgi:hypothetical protein